MASLVTCVPVSTASNLTDVMSWREYFLGKEGAHLRTAVIASEDDDVEGRHVAKVVSVRMHGEEVYSR